ncbi:MAG: GerMN domain-containing protein [Candidatus Dojkabacteria bacterium]|nr:MAG: GerMN domain-containing protein [Candidatus Dojkabacteria bacterium]
MKLTQKDVVLLVTGVIVGFILTSMMLLVFNIYGTAPESLNGNSSEIAPSATPTPTNAILPTTSATPEPEGVNENTVPVKIYLFSQVKFNEPNQQNFLTEFSRTTNRKDVGTFAIEQLIKGPDSSELASGHLPTFGEGRLVTIVMEDSNCGGKDFSLAIDSHRLATVKFCRNVVINGDLSGGIITEQITMTLKQFPTISRVVVLNKAGSCFNDMRGATTLEDCTN